MIGENVKIAVPEWFFITTMAVAHKTFGGLSPKIVAALYAQMMRSDLDFTSATDIVRAVELMEAK